MSSISTRRTPVLFSFADTLASVFPYVMALVIVILFLGMADAEREARSWKMKYESEQSATERLNNQLKSAKIAHESHVIQLQTRYAGPEARTLTFSKNENGLCVTTVQTYFANQGGQYSEGQSEIRTHLAKGECGKSS